MDLFHVTLLPTEKISNAVAYFYGLPKNVYLIFDIISLSQKTVKRFGVFTDFLFWIKRIYVVNFPSGFKWGICNNHIYKRKYS